MSRLMPPRRMGAAVAALLILVAGVSGCAGSPTSSPENAARTFLDAMKADDLEAAMVVAGLPLTTVDDQEFVPISALEQAAASTGVTGYEIVNLTKRNESSATVTATLTGGAIAQIEFSLERGGADGQQWLITRTEPGMTALTLRVPEHWSATLAGGTEIAASDEVSKLLMFPGTSLEGHGAWTNDDGLFEPIEFFASADWSDRVLAFDPSHDDVAVPSAKLIDEAMTAVEAALAAQIDEVVAVIDAEGDAARVVVAPTVEVRSVDPDTSSAVTVWTEISWGRFEVCRNVSPPFLPFAPKTPMIVAGSFHPGTTEFIEETTPKTISYRPYDEPKVMTGQFGFQPGDAPLSGCGR